MDKADPQQQQASRAHSHSSSHNHIDSSFAPEPPPVAGEMVDYLLLGTTTTTPGGVVQNHQQQQPMSSSSNLDKLSFSDVLQFADFGPRLALNQPRRDDAENGSEEADDDDDDDGYFFRFHQSLLPAAPSPPPPQHHAVAAAEQPAEGSKATTAGAVSESTTTLVQQQQHAADNKGGNKQQSGHHRRKRPRTVKTSEEVESQRMTHIAVERNRRRQMNEYLRILRSLMPGSYVQRGDQASIIGGAIEFIRELEQLIQCLESQKRRRLYGGSADAPRPVVDAAAAGAPPAAISSSVQPPPHQPQPLPPPFFPPPSLPFPPPTAPGDKQILDLDVGLREEVAENKSCLADIEVRALGPDAIIKILSRRRPGQLIKTIAALEDMQMTILHTNITTIEQTVLYSFNVKIAGDARFSAEDIAGAVHQILSFIDINYTM